MGIPSPAGQEAAIDEVIAAFAGNTEAAATAVAHHKQHQRRNATTRARTTNVSASTITLAAVSYYYKRAGQTKPAVKDVSLAVHTGEVLAICGPDGSGKTTMLELMGGLERPAAGDITIMGRSIARLTDNQLREMRRATIGFMVSANYVVPELSVYRNLEIPAMFAGLNELDRRVRIEEFSHAVGLFDKLEERSDRLTPLENQYLALARALINQPRVIIADEPTRQLDDTGAKALLQLFHSLQATYRLTIVLSTTSSAIAELADRWFRIEDGAIKQ